MTKHDTSNNDGVFQEVEPTGQTSADRALDTLAAYEEQQDQHETLTALAYFAQATQENLEASVVQESRNDPVLENNNIQAEGIGLAGMMGLVGAAGWNAIDRAMNEKEDNPTRTRGLQIV